MTTPAEADIAARLIERLLIDPAFRASFRRDPAAACRAAGLESLAEEMALGAGKAMHTLDVRESRSSLAGVMMAAAMEGVGLYQFSTHVAPHLDDLGGAVGDVLSRVDLPAIRGALAGGPEAARAAVAPDAGGEGPVGAAGAPDAGGTATAGDGAEIPGASDGSAADGGRAQIPRAGDGAAGGGGAEIPGASDGSAAAGDGGAETAAEPRPGGDKQARGRPEEPRRTRSPAARRPPAQAADAPVSDPAAVAQADPPVTAPPAAGVVAPAAAPSAPIDPADFGAEGEGGTPSAETLALLKNPNLVFDEVGIQDLKEGRIDPRIVAVLTKLAEDHKITVSCMCSDHSKMTASGFVSNHWHGRGLDIAAVDGVPVNASNFDAREIAMELQELPPDYRPDEIGTPWAINGPGYFTDAGHQDHLHVGFKTLIDPTWKPPADVAATTPAAPAAPVGVAAAQGAPAAAASPFAPAASDSIAFKAVTAKAAREASDSIVIGAVSEPQAAPAAAASFPDAPAPAGSPAYPGDDAPKPQIAAWMAAEARKRGLPPELPVMAALVESNLTNVNFGDADSLGYFQMRTSIWDSGPYQGFATDPAKQIDWFLDTAEQVKSQRLAAGLPIDDPNQYGEWIADIERPAAQYRGRYQLRFDQTQDLLRQAPAAPPPPPPEPAAATPVQAAADAAAAVPPADGGGGAGPKAQAALAEVRKHLGTPYQWGGSTPETGFDCSGLVQWAYAKAGVQIPRVTHDQIEAPGGEAVERGDLLPGDLVFFQDESGYVYHVGMSLGGDRFIHAPRTGDVVREASLDEAYFASRFAGGRRFDEASGAPAAPVPAPAVAPARAVDPDAVAAAEAAVARDAVEARRSDSILFKAIRAQESRNHGATVQFLTAIDPEQARRAAEATPAELRDPAAATPAVAASAPAAAPSPPADATAPDPGPSPSLGDEIAADYPGDDASQAELAKWMAKKAQDAGLPPELPVMAALVESGVKNLNFGDADSVGFFQMRVGIWNRGAYAGYPGKPHLQVQWFIDQALAERRRRLAAGRPVDDPREYGEWIADVERPAEQYRGRYQLRLAEARRLLR